MPHPPPSNDAQLPVYIYKETLAAMAVSIASMTVGFSSGYTSPALVSMDEEGSRLTLTSSEKSWVGSLMPLSALVGSLFGGYLVDTAGRKGAILGTGPVVLGAFILIGAAQNVWMIYVGRVLSGLCVGLLSLCNPLYLAETIDKQIRGTLGLLPTTLGNLGILTSFLIGAYVDWSTLAFIGCIIPLIFFIMMFMVPETPRLLIAKGNSFKARSAIRWFRGSKRTATQVNREVQEIKDNIQKSSKEKTTVKGLFQKRYMKPFALSLGLMIFQQLSGINAVVFYTVSIFKMSGSNIDEFVSTIIMGVVNLLATLVSNVFIDKFGRKALLYISDIFMILSLGALSFFFFIKDRQDEPWISIAASTNWLPLLCLVVYIVGFSLGFGPIPWLFMAEALPAKIRGKAASIISATNWTCTFIITKNFTLLLDLLGKGGTFLMFSIIMLVALVFVILFVVETKGKSLESIEKEFRGRSFHHRSVRADRRITVAKLTPAPAIPEDVEQEVTPLQAL